MHRVQKLIIPLAFALGAYFGLTWFFFGSSHPCGILEARQRSFILAEVHKSSLEDRKLALELMKHRNTMETGTKILEDIRVRPKEAVTYLHEHVWRLTPAQCTWRAISWNLDPYKIR